MYRETSGGEVRIHEVSRQDLIEDGDGIVLANLAKFKIPADGLLCEFFKARELI